MRLSTKEMALTGFFAALTAVCAQVSFKTPFTPVPVTLQTFAVFMSAVILGSTYGTLSQVIYIFLGLTGLPVFANAASGLSVLLGPTGGYLWSFPIAAFLVGIGAERKKRLSRLDVLGLLIIGVSVCYTLGTLQLALVADLSLGKALTGGVLPFLPFELLKIAAAAYLGYEVRRVLAKAKMLN